MIDKKEYMDKVVKIGDILKKYEFFLDTLPQIAKLQRRIDDYAFRVILIGGFSSGKSALLNKLIGRQLFKENQGPETSVPAEISWGPLDKAIAVMDDNSQKEVDIATATANLQKGTAFISMTINVPFLKQRPDLILVDFPGFDSNIEAHNKAINSYLQKGSAFILLLPAKNGGLTESDRRFVKESSRYPQSLSCFISKSDLVTPEQCKDIKAYATKGIRALYGVEIPLDDISVIQDYDQNFEEKIAGAIDGFNPQYLFELSFGSAINELALNGLHSLEEYAAASKLDTADIDARIAKASKRQVELAEQLERERMALDQKYRHELIPKIMGNLNKSFKWNSDALAQAALKGEQAFADAVQSVVRPVLAGVQGEINANLREIVMGIDFELSAESPQEEDALKKTLLNIVDVISQLPIFGGSAGKQIGKAAGKTLAAKAISGESSVYSGVGAGILAGIVINPMTGVLIGLATLALEAFCGNKQEIEHARMLRDVQKQLETRAIPEIMDRLEVQVTSAVMQTHDKMLDELKTRIEESQATQAKALESAKKEKEDKTNTLEKQRAEAKKDMATLQTLLIANQR